MFLDATPVIYIYVHHVRRKIVYIIIVYIYTYVIRSFLEHCVLQNSVAHCQVYKYGKEAEVQVYTQEIIMVKNHCCCCWW